MLEMNDNRRCRTPKGKEPPGVGGARGSANPGVSAINGALVQVNIYIASALSE